MVKSTQLKIGLPIIKRKIPVKKKAQPPKKKPIIQKRITNRKPIYKKVVVKKPTYRKIIVKKPTKKVVKKIINKKIISERIKNRSTDNQNTIGEQASVRNNRTFTFNNKPRIKIIKNIEMDVVKRITPDKNKTTVNKNNLVSVIIPSYNCEKYIIKTIQSVVNQTYSNWEIIVIDDYSTDNTSKTVNEYIEKNNLSNKIKLIRNGKNRGCYISFNIGIKNCNGKYICILGSDDTYDKNKLKIQAKILDNNSKYICTMAYYKREKRVIKRNRMTVCTIMFRKKVIDKIGYFDSVRYSADDEFVRRLLKVYGRDKVHMLSRVLYYAIIRKGSLTQSKNTGYRTANRKKYWQFAKGWHSTTSNEKLYIGFPLKKRPFPAPKAILGN